MTNNKSQSSVFSEACFTWTHLGNHTQQLSLTTPSTTSHVSPAGFSLQSYFGMQKSTTMDSTNPQVNFKVDDPANFMPPKIEISGIEAKRAPTRPHKLKPRDMNVLTPSGFWSWTSCIVTPPYHTLDSFGLLSSSVPSASPDRGWEEWGPPAAPETSPHSYSSQLTYSDGVHTTLLLSLPAHWSK